MAYYHLKLTCAPSCLKSKDFINSSIHDPACLRIVCVATPRLDQLAKLPTTKLTHTHTNTIIKVASCRRPRGTLGNLSTAPGFDDVNIMKSDLSVLQRVWNDSSLVCVIPDSLRYTSASRVFLTLTDTCSNKFLKGARCLPVISILTLVCTPKGGHLICNVAENHRNTETFVGSASTLSFWVHGSKVL